MLSIQLQSLQFHAYHGFYEEELIIGNDFELNLTVTYQPMEEIQGATIDNIINYVSLYALVKERMQQPTALLETIAMDIARQILSEFSAAEEVNISIHKLHPPILNFEGKVGVSYCERRAN